MNPNIEFLCWLEKTTPPVKGLVWYTDGSKKLGGARAGVYGQSLGRRLSISIGKYATVFQAEICTIMAYAYEIKMNASPEKHVCTCSDSQAALKAFQAAKPTSPLVQQCPKDVEHFHAVFCGIVLGPQTFWGKWKWNCCWARNLLWRSLGKGGGSHHWINNQHIAI